MHGTHSHRFGPAPAAYYGDPGNDPATAQPARLPMHEVIRLGHEHSRLRAIVGNIRLGKTCRNEAATEATRIAKLIRA